MTQQARKKLPNDRQALIHKFDVGGHEGYLTVGMYPDGTPGEIFITMSKQGSTISGLLDCFAVVTSMALQYGVPLEMLSSKLIHTRFEPSGWTPNPDIPMARSVVDYLFRYLAMKFLSSEDAEKYTVPAAEVVEEIEDRIEEYTAQVESNTQGFVNQEDAPPCKACGEIMVRSGSCYKCMNCGETSGCS